MHIFVFSDTHGSHRLLQVPENVDIIICAGDAVEDDLEGGEYDDFIEWFSSLLFLRDGRSLCREITSCPSGWGKQRKSPVI